MTAHGFRHCLLMQALYTGHSELSRHSGARGSTRSGVIFVHWTLGFPEYPMGQVQLDSCRRDLQMAFTPHGSTWHASRQVPSTHLSGSPHSKSDRHEGLAVTLGLHSPLGPINVSAGHVQMTVLMGLLFWTLQVCVGWQGWTRQGSWHSESMQAYLGGQSLSTLHSASTAAGGRIQATKPFPLAPGLHEHCG